MLTACGRIHRTSLADLREALAPRQAIQERQGKGAPKGDRGKGRNGGGTTTNQDEGKMRKPKCRDGGKAEGKRKGKVDRGDSAEQPPPKKKKGEATTPTQAPNDKGKGKDRRPKSEIPCRFFKRGKCDNDPCEWKHQGEPAEAVGSQATGSDLPQLSHQRSATLSHAQPPEGTAAAQPSIQANGPPGLKAIQLPHMATIAALAECHTTIDSFQTNGRHRAVEIGKPYLERNRDNPLSL